MAKEQINIEDVVGLKGHIDDFKEVKQKVEEIAKKPLVTTSVVEQVQKKVDENKQELEKKLRLESEQRQKEQEAFRVQQAAKEKGEKERKHREQKEQEERQKQLDKERIAEYKKRKEQEKKEYVQFVQNEIFKVKQENQKMIPEPGIRSWVVKGHLIGRMLFDGDVPIKSDRKGSGSYSGNGLKYNFAGEGWLKHIHHRFYWRMNQVMKHAFANPPKFDENGEISQETILKWRQGIFHPTWSVVIKRRREMAKKYSGNKDFVKKQIRWYKQYTTKKGKKSVYPYYTISFGDILEILNRPDMRIELHRVEIDKADRKRKGLPRIG